MAITSNARRMAAAKAAAFFFVILAFTPFCSVEPSSQGLRLQVQGAPRDSRGRPTHGYCSIEYSERDFRIGSLSPFVAIITVNFM